jgi:serine/threonine protein kinase
LKKEDALREVRAIEKLARKGIHENLVAIQAHGLIHGMPFTYIDMELCDGNLEDYIQGRRSQTFEATDNSRLLSLNMRESGIANIWDIVEQISSGLQFIHSCEEVHRDLKPRNGRST